MKDKRVRRERTYVAVNSDFDCTGYIQPRSITWQTDVHSTSMR